MYQVSTGQTLMQLIRKSVGSWQDAGCLHTARIWDNFTQGCQNSCGQWGARYQRARSRLGENRAEGQGETASQAKTDETPVRMTGERERYGAYQCEVRERASTAVKQPYTRLTLLLLFLLIDSVAQQQHSKTLAEKKSLSFGLCSGYTVWGKHLSFVFDRCVLIFESTHPNTAYCTDTHDDTCSFIKGHLLFERHPFSHFYSPLNLSSPSTVSEWFSSPAITSMQIFFSPLTLLLFITYRLPNNKPSPSPSLLPWSTFLSYTIKPGTL